MEFEEAMKIPFLDENPGNAAAYIKLNNCIPQVKRWTENDWVAARIVYYMSVSNPAPAWLHDVYKNRCLYDIQKTYDFIFHLLEESFAYEDC